jgi:hypothetical protein
MSEKNKPKADAKEKKPKIENFSDGDIIKEADALLPRPPVEPPQVKNTLAPPDSPPPRPKKP